MPYDQHGDERDPNAPTPAERRIDLLNGVISVLLSPVAILVLTIVALLIVNRN